MGPSCGTPPDSNLPAWCLMSAVEKRYPHTSSKDGRPRHANELAEVEARQHGVLTTRLTPQPHHPRLPAGLQLAMHWWVGSHELRRYDGRNVRR